MNEVYSVAVISKEIAMTIFFVVCIIAVVKTYCIGKKEKSEK